MYVVLIEISGCCTIESFGGDNRAASKPSRQGGFGDDSPDGSGL